MHTFCVVVTEVIGLYTSALLTDTCGLWNRARTIGLERATYTVVAKSVSYFVSSLVIYYILQTQRFNR